MTDSQILGALFLVTGVFLAAVFVGIRAYSEWRTKRMTAQTTGKVVRVERVDLGEAGASRITHLEFKDVDGILRDATINGSWEGEVVIAYDTRKPKRVVPAGGDEAHLPPWFVRSRLVVAWIMIMIIVGAGLALLLQIWTISDCCGF